MRTGMKEKLKDTPKQLNQGKKVEMKNWMDSVEASKTRSRTSFLGKKHSEEYAEVQASIREVVKYTSDPLLLDKNGTILNAPMKAYERLIRACEAYGDKGDGMTPKRKKMVASIRKNAVREFWAVKNFQSMILDGRITPSEQKETPWSEILADRSGGNVDWAQMDRSFKTEESSKVESSSEGSNINQEAQFVEPSLEGSNANQEAQFVEPSLEGSNANQEAQFAEPSSEGSNVNQEVQSAEPFRKAFSKVPSAMPSVEQGLTGVHRAKGFGGVDNVLDELSDYFGDASKSFRDVFKIDDKASYTGQVIRWMFFGFDRSKSIFMATHPDSDLFYENIKPKTATEILNDSKLLVNKWERTAFDNFLKTPQGEYLKKLNKAQLRAVMIYTTMAYTSINGTLRENNISGKIDEKDNVEKLHEKKIKIEGKYTETGLDQEEDARDLIGNIDAAIEAYGGLDEDMILYRGVDVGALQAQKELLKVNDKKMFDDIYEKRQKKDDKDKTIDDNAATALSLILQRNAVGKTISDKGYMSTSPAMEMSFATYSFCPIILKIFAKKGTKGAYINQISQFYNQENEFLLARDTKLEIIRVSQPTKLSKDKNKHNKIIIECFVRSQPPRKTTKALQGK